MRMSLGSKKIIFAILLAAAAGGLFVMFGPPKLMARTETPDFCASCHVMESQYEAWFHTGAHRSIRCIDCHLPHDNIGKYYAWKSIDGMKDVYLFYSGRVPETITLSAHGEKTVQSNCARCHETTVEKIDRTRNCWECHRWLQHSLAGTRLTEK
jgi:cytochrome c nitrite reductase small subunit